MPRTGEEAICMPQKAVGHRADRNEAPAKVVFIGPCTAKKAEVQKPEVAQYVDVAMTFEELQALFIPFFFNFV